MERDLTPDAAPVGAPRPAGRAGGAASYVVTLAEAMTLSGLDLQGLVARGVVPDAGGNVDLRPLVGPVGDTSPGRTEIAGDAIL